MLTLRDIEDGRTIDYSDSQLPDEEIVKHKAKQDKYVQDDVDYYEARRKKPPQYFGSLVTEVGPYQPYVPPSKERVSLLQRRDELLKVRMSKVKVTWD